MLKISEDRTPSELRKWALQRDNPRAAARAYAIANALEGMSREDAARCAGMERQALRDAVIRYNAEGLDGLYSRRPPGRQSALTQSQQAILADAVLKGPNLEEDGVCSWTCEALAVWISRNFGIAIHPDSVGRMLRRNGLSRQKSRQVHPKADPEAQQSFKKKTCATS